MEVDINSLSIRDMKLHKLADKLTKQNIKFIRLLPQNKLIVYADGKPDTMTWPYFQFRLKEIARFNQSNKCICGKKLCCASELHHALISRKNVMGNKECKNLIHCSLNVIELCKSCHDKVTRHDCARFLESIFGAQYIIDWYNSINDKMVSNLSNIEYYLDN